MQPESLRPLLPRYGADPETPIRLLNRSENTTWQAGPLILRVHRHGYHSLPEIKSELAWLTALGAEPGLRCVKPLSDAEGRFVQSLNGTHIVAFAPIAGREVRVSDDLTLWFADLGEISARLHRQARQWARPPGFQRKRWDLDTILGPAPHWGHWHAAPGLDAAGAEVLGRLTQDLTRRLTQYGTGAERFGLIHADLRLANLLADESGLWAIDFDDCGFGWWMYDFAAAVSFVETDPRLAELADLWCDGYRRVGPLQAADVAVLPVLVMLRRILLTAWIGSRADSDTAQTLGGPHYTADTVALAERFLTLGPDRFWR